MIKLLVTSAVLVCILALSGILFVSQVNAATGYYINNFDASSTLEDGCWFLHDAGIQTVGGSNVLAVNGQATFKPLQAGYALDNFTVQFDVFHNIIYGNNSAFQGNFYEATDTEGHVIIRMGIFQRQMHNNDLQQVGGLAFCNTTTGEASHYYFLFNHATEWSTWRLTVTTTQSGGRTLANVTIQINDEIITDFATGMPRPDGMGETWVSSITNEHVLNTVAYQNLLPLPMAGVMIPTYMPTSQAAAGIGYDLMGNRQFKLVGSGATPSYIDNFYYGYANTVPLSTNPAPPSTHYDNSGAQGPTPAATENAGSQALLLSTTLAIVLTVLATVVAAAVVSVLLKKRKQ
ncbi:MAG: hypothetical protein NWE98_04145 [Candidatus Bathyarchaeota archaeon]|nr:hypothetical protein [Candidatus Bathyarchaeota archaeon]